jgi:hypothetical protein
MVARPAAPISALEIGVMNYGREHVHNAVFVLATGRGPIKDRLRDAADPLFKAEMNLSQFPPTLQGTYTRLCGDLTAVQDNQRGSIEATISGLSDDEASDLAGRILRLYVELTPAAN